MNTRVSARVSTRVNAAGFKSAPACNWDAQQDFAIIDCGDQ